MPLVRSRSRSLLRSCRSQPMRGRPQSQTQCALTKPPRKPDSALGRKKQACPNPVRGRMSFHIEPATTDLLTSGSPHGKDMIPEAWDSAVISRLLPTTRNPGPTTISTQNLAEYENPKRTFHDLRFTPVVFDPLFAHQPQSRTECISSSLHCDSARAILRRGRLSARRDEPAPLGPDDWWPAWDVPDTDAWSTDFDSPEMSDDESFTTTTMT